MNSLSGFSYEHVLRYVNVHHTSRRKKTLSTWRQIRKRKKIVGTEKRYVLEHEKYMKSIINILLNIFKKLINYFILWRKRDF